MNFLQLSQFTTNFTVTQCVTPQENRYNKHCTPTVPVATGVRTPATPLIKTP